MSLGRGPWRHCGRVSGCMMHEDVRTVDSSSTMSSWYPGRHISTARMGALMVALPYAAVGRTLEVDADGCGIAVLWLPFSLSAVEEVHHGEDGHVDVAWTKDVRSDMRDGAVGVAVKRRHARP